MGVPNDYRKVARTAIVIAKRDWAQLETIALTTHECLLSWAAAYLLDDQLSTTKQYLDHAVAHHGFFDRDKQTNELTPECRAYSHDLRLVRGLVQGGLIGPLIHVMERAP